MKEDKNFSFAITTCKIVFSELILLAAITLNVVSLALPNWLYFQVDAAKAGGNASTITLDYYTRIRGVFLTCLSDTSAPVLKLEPYKSQVKFDSCFDSDLGNLNVGQVGYIGASNTASLIIALRRLHLALHLASGFFLCLGLLICVICAARRALRGLFVSAGLSLLAAGMQFGAQVVFNNTVLRELLPPADGSNATGGMYTAVYNAWPTNVFAATAVSTGASYYIALAAFGSCLTSTGINMFCAATAAAPFRADSGSGFEPSGSTAKSNGVGESAMVVGPGAAVKMDNFSNLSAGPGGAAASVTSGVRLPRIPVYQNYAAY